MALALYHTLARTARIVRVGRLARQSAGVTGTTYLSGIVQRDINRD
jgi:hypothetical protein